MDNVDIFVKVRWNGGFRGSGKAAAVIAFVDKRGVEHIKVVTTEMEDGTTEQLQLMAVTKALHELKHPCSVGIYVNSQTIRNAVENDWVTGWEQNNWRNKRGKEIKNKEVWMLLVPLLKKHDVGVAGYIARYEPELEKALEEN